MKEQDLRDKFIAECCLFANAEKCVQIAKDYAEQEAIEFSEWLIKYHNGSMTRKELYQLFQNK